MEIVLLVAFAWWFVKFEPLHFLIDYTFEWFRPTFLNNWIHHSLSCYKCVGFWSALIITGNFFTACFVSLISYTFDLCLQKLTSNI